MARFAPQVTTERELKLCAWPQFVVPDLGRAVKGGSVAPPVVSQLDAVYFDTPDLRLLRRGVTLRFRRGEAGGDVWTLKLPSEATTLGLAHREISLPGTPNAMPAVLRDLTRGWAFGARLGRVATIRTTRATTVLLDGAARQIATIDDDDVCGLRGRRVAARFREIEVELAPDAPAKTLRALAKALAAAGAMPAPQVPKLARTLGPEASEPWDLQPVAEDPPELLRARLLDGLTFIVDHHAAVVLDEEPGVAAQVAGAVARMREDLRVFAGILGAETAASLRSACGELLRRLVARCDQDQRLASLRADAAAQDAGRGAQAVIAAVADDGAQTQARLLAFMRGTTYGSLLAGLRDVALDPALAAGKTKRRAASRAASSVAEDVRRARDAVLRSDRAPVEALAGPVAGLSHAVGLAAQITGKPAARADGNVQQLVELVADQRRSQATAAHLRRWARKTDSHAAWSAGLLAGMQLAHADAAAARLTAARRELARKSHWAWLD